ncbi:translation initiation factor IF-2-like [Acinonyx jubatus]|uniref:Translation initiation factor IF-2-like n=1 Tax=Acinonyx jubatus TaxID=32536 RepID=A0ABM3N819_ACIJB|nr:translation initiation factor IF-2-like [Acinonyx jubatus]
MSVLGCRVPGSWVSLPSIRGRTDHRSLARDKIQIPNTKYGFYRMCTTSAPSSSLKTIKSGTSCHRVDYGPSDCASFLTSRRLGKRGGGEQRARRDPRNQGTGGAAWEVQRTGPQEKWVTLVYLKPTRAQASLYRLQTTPRSPTCQARSPAARAPSRLSDQVGDRTVRTHLEGASAPGTAGAHPDRDPEPSRRPLSGQPARAPRRQSQAARPRAPAAARRSHLCRALLTARSQAGRALAVPRFHPRRALAPPPLAPSSPTRRALAPARCTAPPRAPRRGSAPQNTQRAPGAFKGTGPRAGVAPRPPLEGVLGRRARSEFGDPPLPRRHLRVTPAEKSNRVCVWSSDRVVVSFERAC